MTVNVESLRLSICSCSHLPVALSLSFSLLHSPDRLRRELLWEFSTSLFAKAYLFANFRNK